MILHIFIILFSLLILFSIFRYRLTTREYFDESSSSDIESGASTYYDWGTPTVHKHKSKCPKCEMVFIDDITCDIPKPKPDNNCTPRNKHNKNSCKNCDITRHPDIDKYVLKSSVPACPDMSNFATKAMLPACPDMSEYIHRSQVPDCNSASSSPSSIDIQNHNYLSKEHCEKYKKSLFTDIEDWIKSFFGNGGDKTKGAKSHGYGWGSGYGTDNSGYGLNGGDVKGSNADGITINPGKPSAKNAAQQQKDQQDESNYVQGWSSSKMGNAVFTGVPNL